jgi:hypothetical protein
MKKIIILITITLSLLFVSCLYAHNGSDTKCIFENREQSDLWKSDTSGCKRVRSTLSSQIVKKHECLTGKSYSYLLTELGPADETFVNGNHTYLKYYILPAKSCFENNEHPKLAELEILEIILNNSTKTITRASVIMS